MRMHLLIEEKMEPVPNNVSVVEVWDEGLFVVGPNIIGKHAMVEGDPEAIKDWLRPFDGVWFGKGLPMMQHFEVGHIPEE